MLNKNPERKSALVGTSQEEAIKMSLNSTGKKVADAFQKDADNLLSVDSNTAGGAPKVLASQSSSLQSINSK